MVLVGLLLMVFGALAIVLAVLTADGPAEYLGLEVGDLGLFLVGVGAGVAIWWGFALSRFGTRRTLAHRRQQKRLAGAQGTPAGTGADRHRPGEERA